MEHIGQEGGKLISRPGRHHRSSSTARLAIVRKRACTKGKCGILSLPLGSVRYPSRPAVALHVEAQRDDKPLVEVERTSAPAAQREWCSKHGLEEATHSPGIRDPPITQYHLQTRRPIARPTRTKRGQAKCRETVRIYSERNVSLHS